MQMTEENKEKTKIVVKLVQDKVTPGTHRYKELPDNPTDSPVLATVYMKKHAVQLLGNPGSLVITIEPGD
jgi:hypothetical protein